MTESSVPIFSSLDKLCPLFYYAVKKDLLSVINLEEYLFPDETFSERTRKLLERLMEKKIGICSRNNQFSFVLETKSLFHTPCEIEETIQQWLQEDLDFLQQAMNEISDEIIKDLNNS